MTEYQLIKIMQDQAPAINAKIDELDTMLVDDDEWVDVRAAADALDDNETVVITATSSRYELYAQRLELLGYDAILEGSLLRIDNYSPF